MRLPSLFCAALAIVSMSTPSTLAAEAPPVIDAAWLQERIKPDRPRLVWREGDDALIRARIASDLAARSFHDFIMRQAQGILPLEPLQRDQEGRRLLTVSRNAVKRASYLSYAWRVTGERRYLDRIETLLQAVCGFSDWNPSHFLDVAEMALAVSIALDWAGEALSAETSQLAKTALRDLGLVPGNNPDVQHRFASDHNWNQVCNAGMVAAALTLAEDEPDLAASAIQRMVDTLPAVLETYGPDGVYVEGAMYWAYGTEFNVALFAMLDSALGTRFGLSDAKGFYESADFVQLLQAPSGLYYDFYDSNLGGEFMGAQLWFAKETGNARYAHLDTLRGMAERDTAPRSSAGRLLPMAFLWYLRFEETETSPLPLNWVGRGKNPIGIFRSAFDDPRALYLGFKGGRGDNNHGNMDAGSFILELNGVRWSIDPGNQSYHDLETYFDAVGGSLWWRGQEGARWQLLTKNNFGHSALTVNDALHRVDGMASILIFDPERRVAELDLTAALGEPVHCATRRFSVVDDSTVVIGDSVLLGESAREIRWQMVTQADVALIPGGAVLTQDGETLRLEAIAPAEAQFSVRALNPPPHPMDKRMSNLKRIDLAIPAHLAKDGVLNIEVMLTGDKSN